MSLKLYKWLTEILKIGNRAVANARAENKKLGLPNVISKNGIIYYELPDGRITTEVPEVLKKK